MDVDVNVTMDATSEDRCAPMPTLAAAHTDVDPSLRLSNLSLLSLFAPCSGRIYSYSYVQLSQSIYFHVPYPLLCFRIIRPAHQRSLGPILQTPNPRIQLSSRLISRANVIVRTTTIACKLASVHSTLHGRAGLHK